MVRFEINFRGDFQCIRITDAQQGFCSGAQKVAPAEKQRSAVNNDLHKPEKGGSMCKKNSAIIVIILMLLICNNSYAESHGQFVNKVKCEWLVEEGPDRDVKLLDDFLYIDPNGKRWPAPKRSVVDGASIPWPLWNKWIGPPFVGNYRRASVVHDVACELREKICRSSQIAHRMFYDACLCGGVGEIKAKVMYWAVRTFGPKWGDQNAENVLTRKQFIELQKIDEFIKSKNINPNSSYKELEKLLSD